MLGWVGKRMTAAGVVIVLVASPTMSAISAIPVAPATPVVQSINPMIALSLFGLQASATGLCGARALTTVAPVSAAAQTPVNGCVLPLKDEAVPFVEPAMAEAGISASDAWGLTPILLGLTGIAVLAALIANSSAGNRNSPPISVN